jgi:hypothetical protein
MWCIPDHFSCKMGLLTSKDNISWQNTFSFVSFILRLTSKIIYYFQIIKLQIMKFTKRFFFKDGGPTFDLCLMWPRDVHSMSALHATILWRPRPLILCWAWHGRCYRHIARRYADLEVRLVHVVMVIKYEVMLLCFQSLTPFCFQLKES